MSPPDAWRPNPSITPSPPRLSGCSRTSHLGVHVDLPGHEGAGARSDTRATPALRNSVVRASRCAHQRGRPDRPGHVRIGSFQTSEVAKSVTTGLCNFQGDALRCAGAPTRVGPGRCRPLGARDSGLRKSVTPELCDSGCCRRVRRQLEAPVRDADVHVRSRARKSVTSELPNFGSARLRTVGKWRVALRSAQASGPGWRGSQAGCARRTLWNSVTPVQRAALPPVPRVAEFRRRHARACNFRTSGVTDPETSGVRKSDTPRRVCVCRRST